MLFITLFSVTVNCWAALGTGEHLFSLCLRAGRLCITAGTILAERCLDGWMDETSFVSVTFVHIDSMKPAPLSVMVENNLFKRRRQELCATRGHHMSTTV